MANIHFIADEFGIVRVEEREDSLFAKAKDAKELFDIATKGIDAFNPLKVVPAVLLNDVTVIAITDSDRLSEEEKLRYLDILRRANPITDSYTGETIPGEFARTHPPPAEPGSSSPDSFVERARDP